MNRKGEEQDNKEYLSLDLRIVLTNYYTHRWERMIPLRRRRRCFQSCRSIQIFPSLESSFEVIERRQNGREKWRGR